MEENQYNAKRELAEIGMQISMGKATLLDIEKNIEKYLKQREVKEREMLAKVHKEAQGLVEEINQYHDEVKQYKNISGTYTQFTQEMAEKVEKIVTEYNKNSEEFKELLTLETHKLTEIRKDVKNDRELIQKELKELEKKKKELEKERQHLESQSKTLEIAYKQTQKLWKKQL